MKHDFRFDNVLIALKVKIILTRTPFCILRMIGLFEFKFGRFKRFFSLDHSPFEHDADRLKKSALPRIQLDSIIYFSTVTYLAFGICFQR